MKRPLLLSFLLASACRKPAPTPPAPPVASPDVPVVRAADVSHDASAPHSALCQRLIAAGQLDVSHARSVVAGFRLETVGRFDVFARCVESPNGGAWVLTLDEITRRAAAAPGDPLVAEGRWSLTHMNAAGERVSVRPVLAQCGSVGDAGGALTISDDQSSAWGTRFPVMEGFDYDRDGEAEVFLRFEMNENGVDEAPTTSRCGKLWTFRAGAVSAYAPAGPWKLESLRDVDRDGRPDVTTHGPYVGALHYGDTPPPINDERGPEIVMHSLADGTFSMTDAAAVAATRQACDALEADRGYGITLPRVACARMRGRTAAQVLSEVAAGCNDGGNSPADFCNSRPEIRRWVTLVPPATLAP